MTGTKETRQDEQKSEHSAFLPEDLNEGDFAVDEQHGIGIFHGLTRLATPTPDGGEPFEREYLVLEYEGGDKVYVPSEQADRVRRYVGGNGAASTLSRLKGRGWARAVADAREQIQEVAEELAALYTEREATRGHAYGADTHQQARMEQAFAYAETPDQITAIDAIKRDLERPRPMDRLLVGDVGYGKTEVAVRAAFKVVQEGRQVAVLCPTSVLASQHHATFSERLAPFGVRVDLLSRFRSASEQRAVLDHLQDGTAQIVIGTHRLLSEDVSFKDLGLVIVDEEQRFGVLHKEKLKQLRKTVDVLTMTATPIPRTLHMALAGLRDVSLITDPPEGRTAVETTVMEYREAAIEEAIRRELDRGGQVYFLHNRVETIEETAAKLGQLLSGCRVRAAHGQMEEALLEETMADFNAHAFDVLVCTTIIESGVDIPNANTLIVDNADQLGLAQLYQLRGRVGRSDRQAYSIFLYHGADTLTDIARQRLVALREFSQLGAGQKIALRDLELRGAGSLLGVEQSGAVAAIGLELYLRLLENAVRRVKGGKANGRLFSLPVVELPVASGIPDSYVLSEQDRLRLYGRMAAVRTADEVEHLRAELESRFGALPALVVNALALLRLRIRCRAAGVKAIAYEAGRVFLVLRKGHLLPESLEAPLQQVLRDQAEGVSENRVVLNVPASNSLEVTLAAVDTLARALASRTRAAKKRAATGRPSPIQGAAAVSR